MSTRRFIPLALLVLIAALGPVQTASTQTELTPSDEGLAAKAKFRIDNVLKCTQTACGNNMSCC